MQELELLSDAGFFNILSENSKIFEGARSKKPIERHFGAFVQLR